MDNPRTEVSVIIPAYGPPQQLTELLQDVASQDVDPRIVEVLVIDDGSPTPIEVELRALDSLSHLPRIMRKDNGGGPAARNFGAQQAAGDRILFLDQDLRIPPNFVTTHVELGRRFPEHALSAVFVNRALDASGPFASWYAKQSTIWTESSRSTGVEIAEGVREVHPLGLSSTNCSLPRSTFLAAGGFPLFRHSGMEDQALGLVLSRMGVKALRTSLVEASHVESRVRMEAFCERQRAGAAGAVEFAEKFPEVLGRPLETQWNKDWGPVSSGDPFSLKTKKVIRSVLAKRPASTMLRVGVASIERLAPSSRLLGSLYSLAVGTALQSGWRAGCAAIPARTGAA